MRTTAVSLITFPIILSTFAVAINLDCTHIRVDKKKFDFSKLGGAHSISVLDKSRPPAIHNTTYTIDICQPIRPPKNTPKAHKCPSGTNICAIETVYDPEDDKESTVESVIPIAGGALGSGKSTAPKYKRLKADGGDEEGLQMELHGEKYGQRNQMAIIEFQCAPELSGNEGFESLDKRTDTSAATSSLVSDAKNDDDKDVKDVEKSLQFVSYSARDETTDLLRLNWRTKYACEDYEEDDDDSGSKSSHWGVFTWFIILLFMGVAAYLIFGSWLNYNRYGARGWDLLPHGDTIRDIPYMFKDWSKKVVNTVQGGDSRGGYSAV